MQLSPPITDYKKLSKLLDFIIKFAYNMHRKTGWSSDPGPPLAGKFPAFSFKEQKK